ncbi:lipid A deacylase LpxR family protein [Bdellovibrio bacteriovorus]|uniref:lipid A deacylase LpxR family protein n=1 Tax=Bdellovibrio bacteriovorus TaxID=959 RepID=UPI003A7FE61D
MIKTLLLAAFVFAGLNPLAGAASRGESYSATIENDTRRMGGPNSDDDYSSGFRFAYIYAEDTIPTWAPTLTDWSKSLKKELTESTTNFGISLNQKIYTPENTDIKEPILDDRPYAAWLYLGFTANYKTETHSHSLELDIGIVGPPAMGEQVQNGFHHIVDVPEAQGWDNQLDTEPIVQVSYFQKVRFVDVLDKTTGRMFDVIPYAGASLGNALIAAHTGVIGRLGVNIPNDFGPTRPSASDGDMIKDPRESNGDLPWRAYVYGAARGNLVGHNIFIDGSIFHNGPHVTRKPFVAETEFGYGVQYMNFSFIWRFVTVSPEFEERDNFHSFASMTLSYYHDLD